MCRHGPRWAAACSSGQASHHRRGRGPPGWPASCPPSAPVQHGPGGASPGCSSGVPLYTQLSACPKHLHMQWPLGGLLSSACEQRMVTGLQHLYASMCWGQGAASMLSVLLECCSTLQLQPSAGPHARGSSGSRSAQDRAEMRWDEQAHSRPPSGDVSRMRGPGHGGPPSSLLHHRSMPANLLAEVSLQAAALSAH